MFNCIKFDVAVLLLSISSPFVVGQISFEKDTGYENNTCDANTYSSCQKISNCPSALKNIKNGVNPKICRFDDKEPLVCCDMRRSSRFQQGHNLDVITVDANAPANTDVFKPHVEEPTTTSTTTTTTSTTTTTKLGNSWNKPPPIPGIQNTKCVPRDPCYAITYSSCQKISNCPSALEDIINGARPNICSFDGNEPMVCCDMRRSSRFQLGNNAPVTTSIQNTTAQRCQEYGKICTKGFYVPFEYRYMYNGGCGGYGGGVGMVPARPKELPHMALIGFGPENDKSWKCGGSVISTRYILSAAHCTFLGDIGGYANWVRLGELDYSSITDNTRSEDYTIIQRINHPGYNPPLMYNDIALYKVDRYIHFGYYIKPACLHTAFDIPERKGKAAGWGRIEFAGPRSNRLLYANISFVSPENCKNILRRNLSRSSFPDGVRTDSLVCAGEADGSKDTCQGDSGGPLFIGQEHPFPDCLFRQVGITSTGLPCGQENSPGLYTRVSKYVPWIESIVWANDL